MLPSLLNQRVLSSLLHPNDAPITAAPKSAPKSAADNAANADKIVAANSGTQKGNCEGSKKQQRIKRSKEAADKKQPKKKGDASPWTRANPGYRYGQPLLIAAELENAEYATTSLHNYYLQGCAEKKEISSGLLQVWPSSARSGRGVFPFVF